MKFGLQTYALIDEIELGLVSSYALEKTFGENVLFGAYSSVDIKGTILGLEVAFSKKPQSSYIGTQKIFSKEGFKPQFVINFNRRITEKSFLLVEYCFNDLGYTETEFLQIINLLENNYVDYIYDITKLLQPGYVSKNYFFTTFSYEIFDDISININFLSEKTFSSGFVYTQVMFTRISNLTISIEYIKNYITNNIKNEFYLLPYDQQKQFRIKLYF